MATTTRRCECTYPRLCKCESKGWRDAFKAAIPQCTIEDLFEGTNLETHGKELNFGMFIVRTGIDCPNADELYKLLDQDFDDICKQDQEDVGENRGRNAVKISESKNLKEDYPGYESFQCTTADCSCKYDYAKTNKHTHYKIRNLKAPTWFVGTLNRFGRDHQCSVNEVVANSYSPSQRTPPHNDFAPIYARCASIVSASFGRTGVFVWRVRCPHADCGETVAGFENQHPLWQELGGPKRGGDAAKKLKIRALGYAGAVPLFHGDILVMEGTMQTHFEHETLVMSRIKSLEDLLAEYPATIQKSQDLLRDALSSTLETKFDKRLNLTSRFISNHKPICANHISAATTGHQPNALTGCIMPRPTAPRPPDKWLLLETKVALRSYRPCQCPPPAPTILTATR